jgi:hypothetical protein
VLDMVANAANTGANACWLPFIAVVEAMVVYRRIVK